MMKNILLVVLSTLFLMACSNKEESEEVIETPPLVAEFDFRSSMVNEHEYLEIENLSTELFFMNGILVTEMCL